jgi:hypothetical protein
LGFYCRDYVELICLGPLISEVRQRVYGLITGSYETMEELQDYRGLFVSCWKTRLEMENSLGIRYGMKKVKG